MCVALIRSHTIQQVINSNVQETLEELREIMQVMRHLRWNMNSPHTCSNGTCIHGAHKAASKSWIMMQGYNMTGRIAWSIRIAYIMIMRTDTMHYDHHNVSLLLNALTGLLSTIWCNVTHLHCRFSQKGVMSACAKQQTIMGQHENKRIKESLT